MTIGNYELELVSVKNFPGRNICNWTNITPRHSDGRSPMEET